MSIVSPNWFETMIRKRNNRLRKIDTIRFFIKTTGGEFEYKKLDWNAIMYCVEHINNIGGFWFQMNNTGSFVWDTYGQDFIVQSKSKVLKTQVSDCILKFSVYYSKTRAQNAMIERMADQVLLNYVK